MAIYLKPIAPKPFQHDFDAERKLEAEIEAEMSKRNVDSKFEFPWILLALGIAAYILIGKK